MFFVHKLENAYLAFPLIWSYVSWDGVQVETHYGQTSCPELVIASDKAIIQKKLFVVLAPKEILLLLAGITLARGFQ